MGELRCEIGSGHGAELAAGRGAQQCNQLGRVSMGDHRFEWRARMGSAIAGRSSEAKCPRQRRVAMGPGRSKSCHGLRAKLARERCKEPAAQPDWRPISRAGPASGAELGARASLWPRAQRDFGKCHFPPVIQRPENRRRVCREPAAGPNQKPGDQPGDQWLGANGRKRGHRMGEYFARWVRQARCATQLGLSPRGERSKSGRRLCFVTACRRIAQ